MHKISISFLKDTHFPLQRDTITPIKVIKTLVNACAIRDNQFSHNRNHFFYYA